MCAMRNPATPYLRNTAFISRRNREITVQRLSWRLGGALGLGRCYLVAELFPDPGDDLGGGRARREDPGHAHPVQFLDVLVRDDAAAEHHDVGGVPLLEQLDYTAEERHVRTGENGEAHRVHVL